MPTATMIVPPPDAYKWAAQRMARKRKPHLLTRECKFIFNKIKKENFNKLVEYRYAICKI